MVSGTLAPLYSFWVKVGLKRGSGPDRGRSPVEWGDFSFAFEAWLAGSEACLAGSWALEGGTDGRTENLPILQDFVPYRGRCPASAQL